MPFAVPLDSGQTGVEGHSAGPPGLGLDATSGLRVASTLTADPGTSLNYVYGGTTQAAAA